MQALDARWIKTKYKKVAPWLDEKRRRLWAAAEAEQLGYGGGAAVARATGLARNTILAGLKELARGRPSAKAAAPEHEERLRRPGAEGNGCRRRTPVWWRRWKRWSSHIPVGTP